MSSAIPAAMPFKPQFLTKRGLNLHCIFNIHELPASIIASLEAIHPALASYRQLILIGHGGRTLWESLQRHPQTSSNPVDDFTIDTLDQWRSTHYADNRFAILYPPHQSIDLQALGKLAGWHHTSPFMVGINAKWGSWFAYRAVILTDTDFETTPAVNSHPPCDRCDHKACIQNCPANACAEGRLDSERCIQYRATANSLCRETCLARVSCPVADEHRYHDQQINYHYTVSMKMIEAYNQSKGPL